MIKRTLVLAFALLAAAQGVFSVPARAMGGLAQITIFDRAEGRQLPLYWHEGKAYVVGKPGNEYQISVRNASGADILAVVSVDGVNVVSGETAAPDQTGYMLSSGMRYDIRGWRKSLNRTAAFYFTQLVDSYAARTGRPDNVGVIGVAVFRRKVTAPPPVAISAPRDSNARSESRELSREQAASDSASGSGSRSNQLAQGDAPAGAATRGRAPAEAAPRTPEKIGTGHGRSETSVVRNVAFERATPHAEETISIYYDSYNNLLARGIIPPAPVARPMPQPFPGRFVPDPPRS